MTREDAKDFLKYFKSHHGARAILSNDLPWTSKPSMRFHFEKSKWFGPTLSLRWKICDTDDEYWTNFERISFEPSHDKLDVFIELWDAMMSQAKSVSQSSFTFAFFPSKLDDTHCVVDEARVGETFTLPCASSVAEMELKLAITQ